MVLRFLRFSRSKNMRRVITADKVSIGFQYLNQNGKEVGNVRYNMQDGYFVVFTWCPTFSALRKAQELVRLLSLAIRIIKSEKCQ